MIQANPHYRNRAGAAAPVAVFSTAQVAHIGLVAKLATLKPHRIIGDADVEDLAERAQYLQSVSEAFSDYVGVILHDTAESAPLGLIDRPYLTGLLRDAGADLAGAVAFAAEEMREGSR